jgi:hypothetical protein
MLEKHWSSYRDDDGLKAIAELTEQRFGAGEATLESSTRNCSVNWIF